MSPGRRPANRRLPRVDRRPSRADEAGTAGVPALSAALLIRSVPSYTYGTTPRKIVRHGFRPPSWRRRVKHQSRTQPSKQWIHPVAWACGRLLEILVAPKNLDRGEESFQSGAESLDA